MKKTKILLRVTYWWGIIADALAAILMMMPKLFIANTGVNLPNSTGFSYGLLFGMPVMLGWTVILFWADRKPLERKGVLLCLIPALLAYIGVEIYAITTGINTFSNTFPIFLLQTIILVLSITSLTLASKHVKVDS